MYTHNLISLKIVSQDSSGRLVSCNPVNEVVYLLELGLTTRPWDDPGAARPRASGGLANLGLLVNPCVARERMYRVGKFSEGENLETEAPHPDDTTDPSRSQALEGHLGNLEEAPGPLRPAPRTGSPLTFPTGSVHMAGSVGERR